MRVIFYHYYLFTINGASGIPLSVPSNLLITYDYRFSLSSFLSVWRQIHAFITTCFMILYKYTLLTLMAMLYLYVYKKYQCVCTLRSYIIYIDICFLSIITQKNISQLIVSRQHDWHASFVCLFVWLLIVLENFINRGVFNMYLALYVWPSFIIYPFYY